MPEPPFLKLPMELRLKIYSYLIPDQCPYQWPRNERTAIWEKVRSSRTDTEPVTLSLLRTNHQIHQEVLSEIYGSILITSRLRGAGFHLLGRAVPRNWPRPQIFAHIAHLGLEIHVMNPGDEMLPAQQRVIAGIFSPKNQAFPRLKSLDIWIPFPSHFYYHLNGKGEQMRELVEVNLKPFREGKGLERVGFEVGFIEGLDSYEEIVRWRKEMEGIVREFADGLGGEMTRKRGETCGVGHYQGDN